jgi:type II secretory ATPase GspE/PulE/Tfp pilus assembly ATPase PilB-like protein
MTSQLADLILQKPTESQIAEEAKRQGMIRMRQDGILKALNGLTSVEEVLRVTNDST